MTRFAPEAAIYGVRPGPALRPPAIRALLSGRGWRSLIGAAAILMAALGTIAVTVGATPEQARQDRRCGAPIRAKAPDGAR